MAEPRPSSQPSDKDEVERLRAALAAIRDRCGDDSLPEDNPVQMAREALANGQKHELGGER